MLGRGPRPGVERSGTPGNPKNKKTERAERAPSILKEREIAISMNGRGRALDNIFIERLWRSVKYEEVYLHDYETVPQAIAGLGRYFKFYNRERLHQSLDYKTPEIVYRLTA
jgi:transposase InsO family protein